MYKSAQLDLAPLETRCLLHLTTLLPGDALSEKVKDYLIEKMRLTPNIQSLEEIFVYILSQEGYDYARRNTHDKANKIHRLDEGDGDSPRKEYKYKLCDKKHARGAGTAARKVIEVRLTGKNSHILILAIRETGPSLVRGRRQRKERAPHIIPRMRSPRNPGALGHWTTEETVPLKQVNLKRQLNIQRGEADATGARE